MKTIILACIMAATMNAQTINNVTFVGLDNPTITNNSDKAVIGWIMKHYGVTGQLVKTEHTLLLEALASDGSPTGIKPGETKANPVRNRAKTSTPIASIEVDAVLFADGELAGPDTLDSLQRISDHWRALGDGGQNLPTPYKARGPAPRRTEWDSLKALQPLVGRPPFGLWYPVLQYYSGDQNAAGTIFNPNFPPFIEGPTVSGSAVCAPGSPYEGYGVGDFLTIEFGCRASNYLMTSFKNSKRPDGQMDRVQQRGITKDPASGRTQLNISNYEVCSYSDDGSFGKALTEYNDWYGCFN